jgi:hypothetical protein
MAKPRIFISSTFYDLHQIRLELDKFIESLGYEAIRNEEGDIPYDKEDKLEEYCYKEISNVDILVSIIGGRYGSQSAIDSGSSSSYSITQREILTALENDKLVYLFIDKNVLTEYGTYVLNKTNDAVTYKYVDNINIYKFIEEVKSRSRNNNIKAFETADDIKSYLREQFAGLFKQSLIDASRYKEQKIIGGINETAQVLQNLVEYLKDSNADKDEQINTITRTNHPLLRRLKELLEIPYNFYIIGEKDFSELLKARSFHYDNECQKWISNNKKYQLNISSEIFDTNKRLKNYKPTEWNDDWVTLKKIEEDPQAADLPF